ncbi:MULTISPECIES: hypothetical protein [unclassified Flavobacterium]|uniref:hypothetical protein n=1 Tax=unclassified Flavobacterium TaxID=196869 RepID=UPI001291706C|nr:MULTISPECIES: hypothetical protein [unclassified Flavobacterium]MQP53737.1 hypothetical protein [Flavobacterium sp. LMO9]MQP63639.1 hypothetical protein [Flavobacterium sp. LMO6]
MNRISVLILIVIVSCKTIKITECNYIEDYYQTMYKADLEYETGNYEKAFDLYLITFKKCEAKNTFTFNEISKFTESTAILKKFDITYEYAKKQILNGVKLNRFENNENFNDFLSSNYGKKLIKEYDILRKQFETNADFKLRDELISMKRADQMYRNKNYKENIAKQDSIDKIHEKRLIEIFKTVGYPTERIVGQPNMDNHVDVELMLLHTDDSIRINYFVPKIKEFVKNGTASPLTLGRIIDQYYLYNGEPQIYGTYGAQGGGYANMIDDLKKVDSNRISIGLPPLELKEKKDSLVKAKYGF